MNLYAYCLSDEVEEGALDGEAGVGGARVYLLAHAGLSAAVSPSGEERVAVTREGALAHNRVNARLLERTTPLPFRFGVVTTEARLKEYVEANREALLAALAGVRGCVEMSVKIMRDAEAFGAGAGGAAVAEGGTAGGGPAGSGTAFLEAKRRAIAGDERLRRHAEEVAAWVSAAGLGAVARDSSVQVSPSEALAVRAAYLVERARLTEYGERASAVRAGAGARGLRCLTSGPWPPYSFTGVRP